MSWTTQSKRTNAASQFTLVAIGICIPLYIHRRRQIPVASFSVGSLPLANNADIMLVQLHSTAVYTMRDCCSYGCSMHGQLLQTAASRLDTSLSTTILCVVRRSQPRKLPRGRPAEASAPIVYCYLQQHTVAYSGQLRSPVG